MADSQREKIFDAIKTVVAGVEGIKAVHRGKLDPLIVQAFPVANIVPGFDRVEESIGTLITRDLQVFVVLYVSAQTDILAALESFVAKVQKALAADYKLGGLSIDITETAVAEVFPARADETVAGVIVEYQVLYRVLRNDPYNQG